MSSASRAPRPPLGGRITSLLVFFAVLAVWGLVLPRMRVDMSIAHFLPRASEQRVAGLLRSLAEGELASTTVIDVGGDDEDALVETAKRLRDRVRAAPTTRSIRSGVDDEAQNALGEFLLRYPSSAFLPTEELGEEAVRRRVAKLKEELAGPLGPFVRVIAPRDPLGAQLDLIRDFQESEGGGLRSHGGIVVSQDGKHAFLFLTPAGNAFDANLQRKILGDLARTFEEVRVSPSQKLELSGVARYAIHSEEQIRGDIQRIGTLSTAGILLLFLVMFRSARMLLLGLVPLLFGTMVATIGSYLVFGSVHGLTLAFGASLLGVGIDYAEHYFAHYALEPELGPTRIMKAVWPGLWMGALTTVAGLAGLALADFPGAIEMAVFSNLAVVGALIGTRILLPPWMPRAYVAPAIPVRLGRAAFTIIAFFRRRPRWAALPIAITLLWGIGAFRVRFIDDMSALLATDPAIVDEDTRVRMRVTRSDPGRFVIVLGKDEADALEQLDLAHAELTKAREQGVLESFVSLGAVLHSPKAQAESLAAARAALPATRQALADAGFKPELFAPYERSLEDTTAGPVTLAALRDSPLGAVVRPLTPIIDGQQAFIVPLAGVKSIPDLKRLVPHAFVIDERTLLDETYGHVRQRVVLLLVLGLVFVLVLLLARYRSFTIAAAAIIPAILAAICTVAWLGWSGTSMNIMHAIGLSLVLSMGVDYGIFVVEGRGSTEESSRSMVSILTATITTILSFGLLALSGNPALQALGTTTAIGTTASFILCPATLVLLALRREEKA